MIRASGFVVVFLAGCTRLFAQSHLDSTTYPPRLEYPPSLRISAVFDPGNDKTVLQTAPFAIDSNTSISILTALDGTTVTKPASRVIFTFWLSSSSQAAKSSDRRVLLVLNLRDTLDLGDAWAPPAHDAKYSEVLLKGVSVGRFLEVANASSVTFELGPHVMPLTRSFLDGLRDFASRMKPIGE